MISLRNALASTPPDSADELAQLRKDNDELKKANLKLRKRLADMGGADLFRDRYTGGVAAGYDQKRSGSKMWKQENDAVDDYLGRLGEGRTVLDVPVGTGRFLPLYAKYRSKVVGVDSSPDMLAEARRKSAALGQDIELAVGDVLKLDFDTGRFDVVVCVRLLNFFRADELRTVISNIARFARSNVILTIRTHPGAEALHSGDKFTIVHPERTMAELFRTNGLTVVDRRSVSESDVGRNDLILLSK